RLSLWCLFGVVVIAGLWSVLPGSIGRPATESYAQGRAHFRAGEYDQVIALFTEAIKADPKHAEARHYRAWAYERKGEYDRAIAVYSEATRLNPKYSDA